MCFGAEMRAMRRLESIAGEGVLQDELCNVVFNERYELEVW